MAEAIIKLTDQMTEDRKGTVQLEMTFEPENAPPTGATILATVIKHMCDTGEIMQRAQKVSDKFNLGVNFTPVDQPAATSPSEQIEDAEIVPPDEVPAR